MNIIKSEYIFIEPFPQSGFLLERNHFVYRYFLFKRLIRYIKSTNYIKQHDWVYRPVRFIYVFLAWFMPSRLVNLLSNKYALATGLEYFTTLSNQVKAIVLKNKDILNYSPVFLIEDFTIRKKRNSRGFKAVVFLLSPLDGTPKHILKLATYDGGINALKRENEIIEQVRGIDNLQNIKLPRTIKYEKIGEIIYIIEEYLDGIHMDYDLPVSKHMVFNKKVIEHFKLAFNAMGELHNKTKIKEMPLTNTLIEEFVERTVKPFKIGPMQGQYKNIKIKLVEILSQYKGKYVPYSFVHGDFVPSHCIIRKNGINVVDWESGQPEWLSFDEPFYFTINYIMRVIRSEDSVLLKNDLIDLIKCTKDWSKLLNAAISEYSFTRNDYLDLKYFIRFRSLEILFDAINKEPKKTKENEILINDLLIGLNDA